MKVVSISVEPPASAKPALGFVGSCIRVKVNDPLLAVPAVSVNSVPNGLPAESLLA